VLVGGLMDNWNDGKLGRLTTWDNWVMGKWSVGKQDFRFVTTISYENYNFFSAHFAYSAVENFFFVAFVPFVVYSSVYFAGGEVESEC
jgi:hypothetical protein